MLRTLVTGGTGFLGSAIVRSLVSGSESVRVLTRNPAAVRPERRVPGTEYVAGDIFNEEALRNAMNGCTALINAVQFENAPFENPAKGLTYERVDGEGTERQVTAAKSSGIKRIVYLSGGGTTDERSEPWFRAKWRAETAVRESGADWTIFAPSWVYGPEDNSLNKFARFARLFPLVPFIPIIGKGKERIQPLFVGDLARAVHLSLNDPRTHQKTYEIGGPELLTMKEIVRTLLSVLGKRRVIISHPKVFMRVVAGVLQYLPGRVLTPEAIDFITMEAIVDNESLLETLDLNLASLEEGLREYLP